MQVTTRKSLIRNIAARWRRSYEPFTYDGSMFGIPAGTPRHSPDKEEKAKSLDLLDPETATEEDVTGVIGNPSWTRLQCDQCGSEAVAVITIGGRSGSFDLCESCVKAMAALDWTNR